MQVFELNFNLKATEDRYFGNFRFEPENSHEKSLGNLYILGELENTTLQNAEFLPKLSQKIKRRYYDASFKKPNKALAESLKSGNDFLSEEIKKENVGWLGNFNFAALAIKGFDLSFTVSGNLKILLLRTGQINDISKDLNATEIEPFPLKVFFNVVSGKLAENDVILAVSKNLFDFFAEKKIIEKIAELDFLSEKKIKEILPLTIYKEAEESGISGICLIADMGKKKSDAPSKAKEIIFKKGRGNLFKKIKENINKLKKIYIKDYDFKKNIVLIFALIIILILGFELFKKNEELKRSKDAAYFQELTQKFVEAENAIKNSEDEKASGLLKDILGAIPQFILEGNPKKAEAENLKFSVEEKLFAINKIKKIENPEVLTNIDIKSLEFVPQTLLISGNQMYLSSPISPNLFVFSLNEQKGNVFKYSQTLELADDSSSNILFFSKPDKIITFESSKFKEEQISLPETNFSFDLMSSYASNIYFLDQEKNEILKYSYSSNFKWSSPKISLSPKEKTKYLAIDSYFWLLNENDKIDIYYKGDYQKTLSIDIFPEIKNITKIKTKTGLPYIYFLEPSNNRLIITDKNGRLVEQLQSEKFDNLKDFSISNNGSTIWILNGEQIFRLEM